MPLKHASMQFMTRDQAIALLGGTVTSAAAEIGVSYQAVNQWPDELPKRIEDRVLAALARKHLPKSLIGTKGAPKLPAKEGA